MIELRGQTRADLSRLIRQMDQVELNNAVKALLGSRFPELPEAVEHHNLTRFRFGGVSLRAGRYLVYIRGSWVKVQTWGRPKAGDKKLTQALQAALEELVTGLAGMALQRLVASEIVNAG